MNHVAARPEDEEITRIREVIGRHRLPGFIVGYDIRLGELDGDPAFWVIFRINEDRPASDAGIVERLEDFTTLRRTVISDLFRSVPDRWPYYRFHVEEAASNAA